LEEIDAALGWLSERAPAAASRWHDGLLHAIRSLEENPQRCGAAPENESFPGELRQLLYGKRRGVYRILRGDTVFILRVRHGARKLLDPDTW